MVLVVPEQSPSFEHGAVPPVITIPSSPLTAEEEQTLVVNPAPRLSFTNNPVAQDIYWNPSVTPVGFSTV